MIMTASHRLPRVGDRLDDLVETRADAPGFDDQLLDLVLQQPPTVAGTRLRRFGHHRTDSRAYVEPPFLDQVLHHLVSRVGMDLEVRRKRPDRRKVLTRPQDTTQHCARCGKDDLVEDRPAGNERQSEWCHSGNVTHVTVTINSPQRFAPVLPTRYHLPRPEMTQTRFQLMRSTSHRDLCMK